MDWNEICEQIIAYVEEHLQRTQEPLDHQKIEKIAGCSYSFFQKVFSYMNHISFGEYVRYRKLTLAGYDLKSTSMKVIDLGYKYGYDSPTSFTKAFQQFHGVTPKEARINHSCLRVYPRMTFCSNQKYTWTIKKKQALRLIGKKVMISTFNQQHYFKIPEFWNQCQRDGTFSNLISLDKGSPQGLFGLFIQEKNEEIEYAIMVQSDHHDDSYEEVIIPASTWVIFDCYGPVPQSIQQAWTYIHNEWLIQYPFLHADCPEIEWYSADNAYDQNYLSQIWIPIKEE